MRRNSATHHIVVFLFFLALAQIRLFAGQPRQDAASDLSRTQTLYQQGKALYEKGQFSDALKYFNVVLALDDTNELAREYADLAQQRLKILADRGYTEWRNEFDARQFEKAAEAYQRIRADQQPDAAKTAARIEAVYQERLTGLVDSWKTACTARELSKLDSIRNEAQTVAPGLPFGRDALTQMQPCPSAAAIPATMARNTSPSASRSAALSAPGLPSSKVAANPSPSKNVAASAPGQPSTPCVHVAPELALTRVKTKVNPAIDPRLRAFVSGGDVGVHIDEEGSVTVTRLPKTNARIAEAIKSAVEQWKFGPTIIGGQPRCVETDLKVSLSPIK